MLTAATTRPSTRTGAATVFRPSSSSLVEAAKPRRRTSDRTVRSASGSVIECRVGPSRRTAQDLLDAVVVEGDEHLAAGAAVDGAPAADPVRRDDRVTVVDLVHVQHVQALEDPEGHGLAGPGAERLDRRARRGDEARAVDREAREPDHPRRPAGSGPTTCAPRGAAPRASRAAARRWPCGPPSRSPTSDGPSPSGDSASSSSTVTTRSAASVVRIRRSYVTGARHVNGGNAPPGSRVACCGAMADRDFRIEEQRAPRRRRVRASSPPRTCRTTRTGGARSRSCRGRPTTRRSPPRRPTSRSWARRSTTPCRRGPGARFGPRAIRMAPTAWGTRVRLVDPARRGALRRTSRWWTPATHPSCRRGSTGACA